jgi:hypothetical protein
MQPMFDWLRKRRDVAIDAVIAYFAPRLLVLAGLLWIGALATMRLWLIALLVVALGSLVLGTKKTLRATL